MQPPVSDPSSIYDLLGQSEQPIRDLVEAFYSNVEGDHQLRSLYPDDLEEAKNHLFWFLVQRFGGPDYFNQKRGAPMLRRRHVQFAITSSMAEHWFRAMSAAIESVESLHPHRAVLLHYFEDAAVFLINRQEPMAVEISTPDTSS